MSLADRVRDLGPWFHNLDLDGVKTAPEHFLGDYPAVKWQRFAHIVPDDLSGARVLDIGCNAGFYSIEMRRRGARVTGIDPDERYLAQARFVADFHGLDIDFRRLSVYDIGGLGERYDIVLFMGVLYHLRHPLLALDLIADSVMGDLMIVQSMLRGSDTVEPLAGDYPFEEEAVFERPSFPRLFFVESKYAGDQTNWWIPNRACMEAMLRSAGFTIVGHPEREVFCCRLDEARRSREGGRG
jgi:tRNA (mo5U34)-methyltransferase